MSEVIRLPPRLRVVAAREPIVLPPPPRVMDAARRVTQFRAFLAATHEAAHAESLGRKPLAAHLRAEAARLLEASRS